MQNGHRLSATLCCKLCASAKDLARVMRPLSQSLHSRTGFSPTVVEGLHGTGLSLRRLRITKTTLLRASCMRRFRTTVMGIKRYSPGVLKLVSSLMLRISTVSVYITFGLRPRNIGFSIEDYIGRIGTDRLTTRLYGKVNSNKKRLRGTNNLVPVRLVARRCLGFYGRRRFTPHVRCSTRKERRRPTTSNVGSIVRRHVQSCVKGASVICTRSYEVRTRSTGACYEHSIP